MFILAETLLVIGPRGWRGREGHSITYWDYVNRLFLTFENPCTFQLRTLRGLLLLPLLFFFGPVSVHFFLFMFTFTFTH